MKVKLIASLALLVGLCSWVAAQQAGPGTSPPTAPSNAKDAKRPHANGQKLLGKAGGAVRLLVMPAVQAELKLTPDQKAALQDVLPKIGGKKQQPPEAPKNGDTKGAAATAMEKVKSTLSKEQMTRLHELTLQFEGPIAIIGPEVSKTLAITPEQKANIQETLKSSLGAVRDKNVKAKERRDQLQTLKKEIGDKILALLTDDQRSKWKSMLGTPFKFQTR